MLSRKISNYIFYVILIGIIGIVYLIRTIMLGGLVDRIDTLDANNILLQSQIDNLEDVVQTNKDVQESHLYELYNQVPQKYSQTELTYLIISKLELVGIDESSEYDREIKLNSIVSFDNDSSLSAISKQFNIVEIGVNFYVTDLTQVSALIDLLNESTQLFFVNYVDFNTPVGEENVWVTIDFYAFYEKTT